MRIRLLRLLTIVVAAALVATACADGPRADELVDERTDDTATDGGGAGDDDRAVSVTENDYDFVDNALFLTVNIGATRFSGGDVLQPDDRIVLLDRVTDTDIRALAAALYADPASVEVAKVLPQ